MKVVRVIGFLSKLNYLTFFIALMTASSVRHQSQEPMFSSPFVISTSDTVTFSNPFCCLRGEDVTHPKFELILFRLEIAFPWNC